MTFNHAYKSRCGFLLLALAALSPLPGWAACSRPIIVATAALGVTITVNGQQVGGVVPDQLRSEGAKVGCEFKFVAVPRARAEAMFATGQSDILLAAVHTEPRDKVGTFVLLTEMRAMFISVESERSSVHSMREILARPELRVALVRGFDYGESYRSLQQQLTAQKRLFLEPTPGSVARLINAGMADATIMLPVVLAGAIADDARVEGMIPRLRIEALDELPWGEAGSYISNTSLTAGDRAQLVQIFIIVSRSNAIWEAYRSHYPANVLDDSIRMR